MERSPLPTNSISLLLGSVWVQELGKRYVKLFQYLRRLYGHG